MKWYIVIWFVLGSATYLCAQGESKIYDFNSIDIQMSYGIQQPVGKLNERFGYNSSFGGKLDYRLAKTNISFGIDASFIFGSKVKEDVISPLYGRSSFVYGADGLPAIVFLRERGYYVGAHFSKLWRMKESLNLKGLKTTLGAGFLSHHISVLDDTRSTLQFIQPYAYGYDRLTYGFSAKQDIGYQYYSANNRINFYVGLNFIEALTKNRRAWNFTPDIPQEEGWRWDVLMGAEIAWIIPIYFGSGSSEKLIYY